LPVFRFLPRLWQVLPDDCFFSGLTKPLLFHMPNQAAPQAGGLIPVSFYSLLIRLLLYLSKKVLFSLLSIEFSPFNSQYLFFETRMDDTAAHNADKASKQNYTIGQVYIYRHAPLIPWDTVELP
jgi:hypothetical protein